MKKYKEIVFSLEAWRAGGIPYTRNGSMVRDLAHFPNYVGPYKLVGVLGDARRKLTGWAEDGYSSDNIRNDDLILRMPITMKRVPLTLENAPRWIKFNTGNVCAVVVADNESCFIGVGPVRYTYGHLAVSTATGSIDGINFTPLYTEVEV